MICSLDRTREPGCLGLKPSPAGPDSVTLGKLHTLHARVSSPLTLRI